jgi:hypothetical protein
MAWTAIQLLCSWNAVPRPPAGLNLGLPHRGSWVGIHHPNMSLCWQASFEVATVMSVPERAQVSSSNPESGLEGLSELS